VDYFFEAYEQLTRCTLQERVERHRYNDATKQLTSIWRFWWRSALARLDRRIVLLSGWVTDWGKSIVTAVRIFAGLVGLFTVIYFALTFLPGRPLTHEILRSLRTALNVTLVAGYTAEFRQELPRCLKIAMLSNLIVGLAWYSLVIPALTRRILR